MKIKLLHVLMLIAAIVAATASATAQDKPRWAIKGAGSANKERTNDTYILEKFETFGPSLADVRKDAPRRIKEYVAGKWGGDASEITVEPLSAGNQNAALFNDPEGDKMVQGDYEVKADGKTYRVRLVDEYVSFDENVDGSFDYTLYQLYAMPTQPETTPVYDEFGYTRSYRGQALVRSLIPGMGQWYKGQKTKAYTIWGAEALFIGGAIYANHRRSQYWDDYKHAGEIGNIPARDSYHSKSKSWRLIRNISIAGAAATYVINLVDAALSKGPREIKVKKADGHNTASLSMGPALVYDPQDYVAPALGVRLTF